MANYAPLAAVWPATGLPFGVSGTPLAAGDSAAAKLDKIGGWLAAGPAQDVPIIAVVNYLALAGKLVALQAYAASPPATPAGAAAAAFFALVRIDAADIVQMSNPVVYAAVQGWLDAWAGDANTGITGADVAAILGLAATFVPWWQSAGFASPLNLNDVAAAGLT